MALSQQLISTEQKHYAYQIGNKMASALAGFIAGNLLWIITLLIIWGVQGKVFATYS